MSLTSEGVMPKHLPEKDRSHQFPRINHVKGSFGGGLAMSPTYEGIIVGKNYQVSVAEGAVVGFSKINNI